VTGVQTCALPIWPRGVGGPSSVSPVRCLTPWGVRHPGAVAVLGQVVSDTLGVRHPTSGQGRGRFAALVTGEIVCTGLCTWSAAPGGFCNFCVDSVPIY